MAQSYRVECPPSQVHCVLIADDLTGACDAAAPFCSQGARVRVLLNLDRTAIPPEDVLSISTGSRDLPVPQMQALLFGAAEVFRKFKPAIIFKKIDSTLRGNPGEEIAAALQAFNCEVAVITPAFPQMGRHVRDGFLHVEDDVGWRPVHLNTLLRGAGMDDCEHVSPSHLNAALARRSRFISLDCSADEDLEMIVTEALRCGRRVLWAGSAGLASTLARAIFPGRPNHTVPPQQGAPVLFAIGSDHVVTAGQLTELNSRLTPQHVDADSASSRAISAALSSGRHTVLQIRRNTTDPRQLADMLIHCRDKMSVLLLSGGDTAALVCRALAAESITLQGEIVTGLPWGTLKGGLFDKMPVATKSGAFGRSDALIKVADFFSCLDR